MVYKSEGNSVDIDSWLRLIRAEGVGSTIFARLIKHFASVEKVLDASVAELCKVDGIGYRSAEKIVRSRDNFDVESELELAQKLGVWIVNLDDSRYPTILKRIDDPPPVLYVKGTLTKADNLAVAIVGSRRCSLYGQEQASRLSHFLSSAGFTVVSGMARGIDTVAHQAAISAGGRTIAVQGCGLANVFPPENKKLFGLIAGSGACISELPLNYEPLSENFPPRNRIIAGLSLGTIVIEAALRSGALITARAAIDYNREVMAVPGKIDSSLSKGAHQLIKQGARLVDSVEDVIESLGYITEQLKAHTIAAANEAERKVDETLFDFDRLNLKADEKVVYDCLSKEPVHADQLISGTDMSAGSINAALISLRLKGLIRQLPGSLFLRK